VNIKQLFNMALISRLTSLLCLGICFYCYYEGLDRVTTLALAFSFTGWILGSFFLGLFHSAQAVALENELQTALHSTLEVVKDVTDGEEKPSHPLFKDYDNE